MPGGWGAQRTAHAGTMLVWERAGLGHFCCVSENDGMAPKVLALAVPPERGFRGIAAPALSPAPGAGVLVRLVSPA